MWSLSRRVLSTSKKKTISAAGCLADDPRFFLREAMALHSARGYSKRKQNATGKTEPRFRLALRATLSLRSWHDHTKSKTHSRFAADARRGVWRRRGSKLFYRTMGADHSWRGGRLVWGG